MPRVYFGRKDKPPVDLDQSPDLLAIRTLSRRSLSRAIGFVASPASAAIRDSQLVASFPDAGVEVYRVPVTRDTASLDDRKLAIRRLSDVEFAGGVLVDPESREPILYTENLFVKFFDSADPDACVNVLREFGFEIKSQLGYAANAYYVAATTGIGQRVFQLAESVLQRDDVEYAHPELVRTHRPRQVHSNQWHLKRTNVRGTTIDAHANVEAAHALSKGERVTIAIIVAL